MRRKILELGIVLCMLLSVMINVQAEATISGTQGDNISWTLKDGTLTISGSGDLKYANGWEWSSYKEDISKLVINKGVNFIPSSAFTSYTNLKEIELSYTVIGHYRYETFPSASDYEYTIKGYNGSFAEEYVNRRENNGSKIKFESMGNMPDEMITSGKCGDNATWKLSSYGDFVVSGSGAMYDYSLSVDTAPWVNYIDSIKTITIDNGITRVGDYAFFQMSPMNVVKSLSLPNTLKTIGERAFYGALDVESISFPEGLTNVEKRAFQCCKLRKVILPDSMREIGMQAFQIDELLGSIKLGNGVKTIGSGAFSGYLGQSITIPASVENMDGAFVGCDNLSEIFIDSGNKNFKSVDGVVYSKDGGMLILCPSKYNQPEFEVLSGTKKIADGAFSGCVNIITLNIPFGVEELGNNFVSGCENLSKLIIPRTVTSVYSNTFYSSMVFSNKWIDTICYGGSEAEWNSLIENINLNYRLFNDGTTFIWNYNRKPVSGGGGNACGDNLDWSIETDGTLKITGTGDMYDFNYSNMETGAPWFEKKDKITSLVIGAGVTSIGENAFYGMENLASIELPDGLTSIGVNVFAKTAYSNNDKNWENGMLYIGNYLIDRNGFEGTSLVIKDGTTCIAELVLYKWNYDYITIPSSMKYINDDVFANSAVSKIYYGGTWEQWENIVIGENNEALSDAEFEYKTITSDPNLKVKNLEVKNEEVSITIEAARMEKEKNIFVCVYDEMGCLKGIEAISNSEYENYKIKNKGTTLKVMMWEKDKINPLADCARFNISV